MNKRVALSALLGCLLGAQVHAQTNTPYPSKPIKLMIGFAPGGAADHVARTMSDAFGRALGASVVVENRAGAGSSIAAEIVAKAPADGYTILIASPSSISVNPALNPKLGYTPKDLAPVTKITTSPLVVAVNPNIGIQTLQDLMARAKKEPGRINYATSGNGSAPHLGAALFTQLANVEMTHIPFRGGGPAIQSIIAGDTQVTFGTPPSVLPMVQAGRLKALAVSTRERTALVPGVPGMREAGLPEYSIEFWYGIFVPAATPPAVVKKIFEAAQSAMDQANVKATLAREGTDVELSK
jgi:tripartite-type tricarboxylate transporter receptor subunit TctC